MKRPDLKAFFQKSLSAFKGSGSGHNAFRGGGYAMVITAIVLAIVLLVNVAVSALPTNLTQFDMSASKLYSITSNTKAVVNNLEDDVTIYWIVQADEEDAIIEALLDKYDSLSDHISVEKKNPDVYPTFAEQYTDEDVANNSLVVECGDRSRYIAYEDIYVTDADLYSYSYLIPTPRPLTAKARSPWRSTTLSPTSCHSFMCSKAAVNRSCRRLSQIRSPRKTLKRRSSPCSRTTACRKKRTLCSFTSRSRISPRKKRRSSQITPTLAASSSSSLVLWMA